MKKIYEKYCMYPLNKSLEIYKEMYEQNAKIMEHLDGLHRKSLEIFKKMYDQNATIMEYLNGKNDRLDRKYQYKNSNEYKTHPVHFMSEQKTELKQMKDAISIVVRYNRNHYQVNIKF